jgi:hypothetical protein
MKSSASPVTVAASTGPLLRVPFHLLRVQQVSALTYFLC